MTFDINKADIIDTTHVDNALASIRRNEENARRPATLLTWGKAVLLGGVGVAAVIAALAFLIHPKIIETTKVVEKPVIIEKPVIVEREVKPKPPVEAPLPPPRPAPVERKWDQLTDKKYEGIITDVTDSAVCYDHSATHCNYPALVGPDHKAVLDAKGNTRADETRTYLPMQKWIGSSAYSAADPEDPDHLVSLWVADHGTLIHFESASSGGKADVIMLRSDGQSLLLDVGLGDPETVRDFILDTGATSMTVTSDMAAELVHTGHSEPNGNETVAYADGSAHPVPTITIDTVRVGKHVLHDVHASITPKGAPMLLGLDVLKQVGRFEVDTPHRTLTFNGAAS